MRKTISALNLNSNQVKKSITQVKGGKRRLKNLGKITKIGTF